MFFFATQYHTWGMKKNTQSPSNALLLYKYAPCIDIRMPFGVTRAPTTFQIPESINIEL